MQGPTPAISDQHVSLDGLRQIDDVVRPALLVAREWRDPMQTRPLQYDAMVRDHERQPFTVMDAVQVLTLVGTSSLLGALIYAHLSN